jgi:hypothetical protein
MAKHAVVEMGKTREQHKKELGLNRETQECSDQYVLCLLCTTWEGKAHGQTNTRRKTTRSRVRVKNAHVC